MTHRLEHLLQAEPEITIRLKSATTDRVRDGGPWLGLAGAVLLFVGVWLPVFDGGRSLTLWALDQDASGVPLFTPMIVGLAATAAVAALRRWSLTLALVGLSSYVTLALAWLVAENGHPAATGFGMGWVVLMLGAMLLLAATAIGEYLRHRDRKAAVDLEFQFPALARRHCLATLQTGWELRN